MVNDKTYQSSLLSAVRLPARLNPEQTAQVLGFQPHDIPIIVRAGLLKPLGGGPRNCVKYFAAFEIENLRVDRKWLDRATKAISRRGDSSSKVTLAQEADHGCANKADSGGACE